MDTRMLIAQLIKPITMPSTITMLWISRLEAPMARITPISRVRSRTLMLIVPISPSPPTMAIMTAMVKHEVHENIRLRFLVADQFRAQLGRGELDAAFLVKLLELIADPLLGDRIVLVREDAQGIYLSGFTDQRYSDIHSWHRSVAG